MKNEWTVGKIIIPQGDRIGMSQEDVGTEFAEIYGENLTEDEAASLCESKSKELGIPQFNNMEEDY